MQNQKSVWGLPLRQQVISLALSGNCLWATLGVSTGVLGAIAQIAPAQAAVLTQWQFNSTTNQLEITVPEGTQPRYFLLAKPARIVLDLPNTQMGAVPTEQTLSGPVQQIRVSQQQAGFTRIVMQLAPNVVFAPGQVKLEPIGTSKTGTRWVLRPLIAGNTATTPTVAATPAGPATTAQPQAAPALPSAQPSQPAATSERSQPTPPAAPPRNRITRNAADLASPADNPSISSSKPSPAIATPPEVSSQPSETLRPAPAATSDTAVFSPRLSPTVTAATPAPATPAPTIQPPQTTPSRDRPVTAAPPKSPATTTAPPTAPKPTLPPPVTSPKPPEAIAPLAAGATSVVPEPQPPVVPVVEEPLPAAPALAPVKPEAPAKPVVVPATSATRPVQPLTNPVTSQRDRPTSVSSASRLNSSPPTTELDAAILPPATFRAQQPITVSVPSQNRTATTAQAPQLNDPLPTNTTNIELAPALPPAVFTPQPSATVTVPSLSSPTVQPAPTRAGTSELPEPSRSTAGDEAVGRVIEFGQPLAAASSMPAAPAPKLPSLEPENSSLVAIGDGIVLPTGTTLQLQYSGAEVLELKPGTPQQEVLLLQTEIRDRNGSILAPVGTPIIGRFETTSGGSRFLAQAISLQGRNVPLSAESGLLGGKLQVSQDKVVRNSALGALAGALVGGSGEEVLGGAAAGAAVTYLASPKPAKLQPGQVLQVRLTEVLRSP